MKYLEIYPLAHLFLVGGSFRSEVPCKFGAGVLFGGLFGVFFVFSRFLVAFGAILCLLRALFFSLITALWARRLTIGAEWYII